MTINDFGKIYVTDMCSKIKISDLLLSYKEHFFNNEVKVLGIVVHLTTSKTGNGGTRKWFQCPKCHRRAGILFKHPLQGILACRKCLDLKYRKSRYKGMIENNF